GAEGDRNPLARGRADSINDRLAQSGSRNSRRRHRSRAGNLPGSRSPALRLSDYGKRHGSTQAEPERDDLLAVEATGSVGQRRRFGITDPQSAARLIAEDGLGSRLNLANMRRERRDEQRPRNSGRAYHIAWRCAGSP